MKLMNLIRGLLGRGVVQSVDESPLMRTVQGEFMLGDVREGLEHFEPYGFTSRVKAGAEILAGFLHGDRSHGVVIVTADRRYRLHVQEGEVAIFDDLGQKVHLTREGIEVLTPKNLLASGGGDVNETAGGSVSASVKGSVSAQVSGNVTLKCSRLTVDCPNSSFTGNLSVQGLISGAGGLTISGGSGAAVDGNLSTTGDVVAAGISLDNHTHTGVHGETSAPH